jgi:hypothetical protein
MDYNLKSLTGSSGYFSLDAAAASATKKPSTGLGSKRGRNLDADMMAGSKTGVTTGAGTAAASQPGFPPDDDDNTPAQLYSNASTSFTNAGVNLNTATFVPSANPSALYNQEQFNIEDYATQIEDYLTGTAISDSLYDALKLPNPAYGGLEIVEDRPLTEQELKQYAPLLDLMNNDITVEELGDMDREDQEAFLKAIGTTGLTMPPRDSVFVGGDFDVATTEEEFVRDLLNQGLTKSDASYWDKLGEYKRKKEEVEEGVVDLSPPEAADQELIPATTAKPDVAPTVDTTPPAQTGSGLMSRPSPETLPEQGPVLYPSNQRSVLTYVRDIYPDNPEAAAALAATIEHEGMRYPEEIIGKSGNMQLKKVITGAKITPALKRNDQAIYEVLGFPKQKDKKGNIVYLERPKEDTNKEVQEKLNNQGLNVGEADGVIGPKTKAAIKEFQKTNGLEVTGKLDESTYKALEVEYRELDHKGTPIAIHVVKNPPKYIPGDKAEAVFNIRYNDHYRGDRAKLGNVGSAEAGRYIGRGPIQITGKEMYKKVGDAIGVDLVTNPELVATDPAVSLAATKAWLEIKGFGDLSPEKAIKLINPNQSGIVKRRMVAYNKYLKELKK